MIIDGTLALQIAKRNQDKQALAKITIYFAATCSAEYSCFRLAMFMCM